MLNKIERKPIEDLEIAPEVEVYHPLTATDYASNKNYLKPDPYAIVLPWDIRWPSMPSMPAYPQALVEDARLLNNTKMKLKMLITDPSYFKKLWMQDSRAQYVENYMELVQGRNKYFEKLQLDHIDLQMDLVADARLEQYQKMLDVRAMIQKLRLNRRQQQR